MVTSFATQIDLAMGRVDRVTPAALQKINVQLKVELGCIIWGYIYIVDDLYKDINPYNPHTYKLYQDILSYIEDYIEYDMI